MARFCGGQSSTVTRVLVLLLPLLAGRAVLAQDLYERPVLVLDPGMHTATIWEPATDAAGRSRSYLATEENFRAVKDLEERNLIVPVVGDLAGPRAIGRLANI